MAQTKLATRLRQRLALTPQTLQGLKVLRMSALEIEEYIEHCMAANPLLVRNNDEASLDPRHDTQRDGGEFGEWPEDDWRNRPLSTSLHEQINVQPMTGADRMIAHAIIDSLDERGYFTCDAGEIASMLGVDVQRVVHQLGPAGIGARSLIECLLLQLDKRNIIDELAARALRELGDRIAANDAELATQLDCDIETARRVRSRLRRLDPFPGRGMQGNKVYYILSDMIFTLQANGSIKVEIPEYNWKGLKVLVPQKLGARQEESGPGFHQAVVQARFLLQAVKKRKETLFKLACFLARKQKAFFEQGPVVLKPLTLQDAARALGLHESTLSRVTHGKYAQTPIGLIELRCFFAQGLKTSNGEPISTHCVQPRIRTLIANESTLQALSDQGIADRLAAEGVEIARGTVGKYRASLGIPSARRRRLLSACVSNPHPEGRQI